jgi:hypothetical protein
MLKTSHVLLLILAVAGCKEPVSTGVSPSTGEWTPAPIEHQTRAPACSDVADPARPNELFHHALVDPAAVSDAIVFGNMEPYSPQEVVNFELGFYLPGTNVPLTAPADLYVQSVRRSVHAFDGVVDWSLDYHVCSELDGDLRVPAVSGNFAHITTMSAPVMELFDAEMAKLDEGELTAMHCNDDRSECNLNLNLFRDQRDDQSFAFVLAAGDALGTGGKLTDGTGPAGIDTNLQDRRYGGNHFINPDRIGSEAGHGAGWRYGACTYEYFAEPMRSAYLGAIEAFGEPREASDEPCGVMEVDRNAEGTAAGLWALTSIGEQQMNEEWSAPEVDVYMANLMVLGEHISRPTTEMMMSTPIDGLSHFGNNNAPIRFLRSAPGDVAHEQAVNVPFWDTAPGTIYCYDGERYGGDEEIFYLVELSDDGSSLVVEKVLDDCTQTAPSDRVLDPGRPEHFIFVR